MHDSHQRPFWIRKRWIAVAVLWLVLPLAYPLSVGPVAYYYAHSRPNWRGYGYWYEPLWRPLETVGLLQPWNDYYRRFRTAGLRDGGFYELPSSGTICRVSDGTLVTDESWYEENNH